VLCDGIFLLGGREGRYWFGFIWSSILFIFILMHNVIMGFISSGNGIPLGTVDGWMNGWIDFALGCMYHNRKWGVFFFFFFFPVFVAFWWRKGKERQKLHGRCRCSGLLIRQSVNLDILCRNKAVAGMLFQARYHH
jgi:hypothetical protein